jgi:putative transposase
MRRQRSEGVGNRFYKTRVIKPQAALEVTLVVELATAEWVDWYTHRRLHGEKGHIPPVEYEANYRATTKPQITNLGRFILQPFR